MSGSSKGGRGLATRAVHAGQRPDPATGAVNTPVYLTSTYRRDDLDHPGDFGYARTANPSRSALERNLAALEGGAAAYAFASGMAAIDAVLRLLGPGDHVVATRDVYGGTRRLFDGLLARSGIEFEWVDTGDPAAAARAMRASTRMLWVETPTNPLLRISDLGRLGRLARRRGARLVVDNTFMTPCLQRPIESGADVVVHSTTKYLNGHSDSVGGCVVTRDPADAERIGFIQKSAGAILSPFDSFLVLRGVKTLPLRMARHEASARRIAAWLERHPRVARVHYPGLASHPGHRLARRQMSGFGGVVSFDLGRRSRVRSLFRRLRLCTPAESLGGVETLISHPASMSHAWLSPAQRRRIGITAGLVRLSVGIEDVEDLIDDLERALGS